jgi:hypothetical protein
MEAQVDNRRSAVESKLSELEQAIKRVEEEIANVARRLKALEKKEEEDSLTEKEEKLLVRLSEKEKQLREKEKLLREEMKQLRETENLLLRHMLEIVGPKLASLSLSPTLRSPSIRESLPRLAQYPDLSQSSSSTRTGHAKTSGQMQDFPVLPDVGSPRKPIDSRIWVEYRQRGMPELPWHTEASIVDLVSSVLNDVIYECGLPFLSLAKELGTFELRPDLWLMRSGGLPVGVVEVKKPGEGVLDNQSVLGELYDYLLHLPNFYGAEQMIGIVTTYREWRVCWLKTEETIALVEMPESIEANGAMTPERVAAKGTKKESSPPGLTPSKKRTDYHRVGDTEDFMDSDSPVFPPPTREMFVSRIWNIEKDNVFPVVASALLKMSRVTHRGFAHPFDDLARRTLLRVGENSFYWDRLDTANVGLGKWDCCPSSRTKNLYLLEDLGVGATGHVWLACSATGAVCVLKFIKDQRDMGRALEVLKRECEWWHKIYPQWKEKVRVAQFCGRPALVMPHFDTPKRDGETVELVTRTLEESFVSKGIKHPDVRWRNIGVYKDGVLNKAVVFDLGDLVEEESSDWVQEARNYLVSALGHVAPALPGPLL